MYLKRRLFTFSFFLGIYFICGSKYARAATYYVSTQGSDSYIGSQTAPWKTIAKANSTLKAGDSVIIGSGTYSEAIHPSANGTSGSPITYQGNSGQTATVTGVGNCVDVSSRSWITIQNLSIVDCSSQWVYGVSAAHITLQNNYFNNSQSSSSGSYSGITFNPASYIFIRNNRFGQFGALSNEWGDIISMQGSGADYGVIENNDFTGARAGHALIETRGRYIIIRNNYEQNGWEKDMDIKGTINGGSQAGPYLIEDNKLYDSTYGGAGHGSVGIQLEQGYSIIRYNSFTNNPWNGMSLSEESNEEGYPNNRIYNNTFVGNGNNYSGADQPAGLRFTYYNSTANHTGNIVLNNIFQDNGRSGQGIQIVIENMGISNNSFINNLFFQTSTSYQNLIKINGTAQPVSWWETNSPSLVNHNFQQVDPQFTNTSSRDFSLKSTSPAIDTGANLTTASNTGSNSTNLTVVDARYFSDGYTLVSADWIKIGTGNPVQIASVNYATNTITLTAPTTWQAGNPVNVYKNSSGRIVFSGQKPDIGALENPGGSILPTPSPSAILSPTPTPTPKLGDANGDGKVDNLDFTIWLNHYSQNISGVNNGNFYSDGKVNGMDLAIWLFNKGK